MNFASYDYVSAVASQHQRELVEHAQQHRMVRLARRQQHQAWRHKPPRAPA
jgi:hypothetical protein